MKSLLVVKSEIPYQTGRVVDMSNKVDEVVNVNADLSEMHRFSSNKKLIDVLTDSRFSILKNGLKRPESV
jgi:hypothetical protein